MSETYKGYEYSIRANLRGTLVVAYLNVQSRVIEHPRFSGQPGKILRAPYEAVGYILPLPEEIPVEIGEEIRLEMSDYFVNLIVVSSEGDVKSSGEFVLPMPANPTIWAGHFADDDQAIIVEAK